MDKKNKVPGDVETTTLDDVQQKAELEKNEETPHEVTSNEPIAATSENPEIDSTERPDGEKKEEKETGSESNLEAPEKENNDKEEDSPDVVQQKPELETKEETPQEETSDEPVAAAKENPDTSQDGPGEPEAQTKAPESTKGPNAEKPDKKEPDEEEHEDDPLEAVDLENASKEELLDLLKKFSHESEMRKLDKALRTIRPHFDHHFSAEREEALKQFIDTGGAEVDFDYKGDETDRKFFELYDLLREKKHQFFSRLENEKEDNLKRKNEILDELRELVDGEESTASINKLKELQTEWKKIGHVPGQHVKNLWASYHALIDRYYDHRSIYFELKELDRQKNLKAKLELCERAEALVKMENIKEAIFQLNELHEEFKHIGPIPREEQEPVWQRFKGASDQVYDKRREFFDDLKKDQSKNLEVKQALSMQVEDFARFDAENIADWNAKTKEVLELQKKWEGTGSLPRVHTKTINKQFWKGFKQFFNNKNAFFKKLEGLREENLKHKEDLVQKADAVKDSEEWDKTAELLKNLQNEWKEIGPVPEKQRNEVYRKFKAACDHFFERKRGQNKEKNREFDENLKKKAEICEQLEACMNADTIRLDELYDLFDQYAEIGFVPRHAIKSIHNRFDKITNQLISLEELTDEQRDELKMHVQVNKLKGSPHGGQKINRKENAIKRKISNLENDINLWKTNLEFFAKSKTANQLKDDFNAKIEAAEKEIDGLNKQLDLLQDSL